MTRFLQASAVILILCLHPLLVPSAKAQEPWEKQPLGAEPAAVLRAAKAVPPQKDAEVVILLDEMRYVLDGAGRSTRTKRMVYKVVTEEASREWAPIEVTWSPWYEERPDVRARVITADGQAHMLDPKTLGESPVESGQPDVYTDQRALRGPLPAIAPGAVVEEEHVVKETAPFFERGVTNYYHFYTNLPVQKSRVIIEAPESLRLIFRAGMDGQPLEPQRTAADGRVRLVFEAGPSEPLEPAESMAPPDDSRRRYVAFTTGGTWKDVATGYYQIVEKQIANADTGAIGVSGQSGTASRQDAVASALAAIRKQVRYTSVTFGAASIVPRSPAETLRRRYGDCKDQSAFLVAALRKANVPAFVALLNTGPGRDVDEELPGFGNFDHAIVYVPGSPAIWVDPTDRYSRHGELSTTVQGRLALIVSPETAELVPIPESPSADNRLVIHREFRLAEYGKSRVIETTTASGSVESNYRAYYAGDEKEIRKNLEEYVKVTFLTQKSPDVKYCEPSDLAKPFELRLEAVEAGRGSSDLRDAVVGVPLRSLWNNLPDFITDDDEQDEKDKAAKKPWRTKDLVLEEPFVTEWRYTIPAPPGFKPRSLPNSETLKFGPAALTRQFEVDKEGTVKAVFRFDTIQRRYSAAEATALREGLRKLIEEPVLLIRFEQVGQGHLEAGRVRDALAEFRRLAAAHPKEALHRSQIARALLQASLAEAAREEARAGAGLDPKSVIGQETLGHVLAHDWVGRQFAKGWDPAGSEAAYRKAIEADPDNFSLKVDLAIVLEHDASGQRYRNIDRLNQAIEIYRSLEEKLKDTGAENNLAIALMWAGRFPELLKQVENTGTLAGWSLRLTALAASRGSDAAFREAAKLSRDDQRRTVLADAANNLIRLRFYAQAADLLAAAARGSTESAQLLSRADVFRNMKRHEDLPSSADDPTALLRRLFALSLAADLDIPSLRSLSSHHSTPEWQDEESLEKLHSTRNHLRTSLLQAEGLPVEVLIDIVALMMKPSIEGKADFGYRLRMPPQLAQSGARTMFTIPENGQQRLLGQAEWEMGEHVLDLINKGELDSARRWLDWAREEHALPGGDDPLAGAAFARLWTQGAPADAAVMRLAAAALAADSKFGGRAVEVLQSAAKEVTDSARRLAIEKALALGLTKRKRYAEAEPVTRRLLAASPESDTALHLLSGVLVPQRKWQQLEEAALQRLARKEDDPTALRLLQSAAASRGDGQAARKYGRRLVESGKATAVDLNNLAWASLVDPVALEEGVEHAQKAVVMSKPASSSTLHTLAALYAEMDKAAEARDVLLQSLKTRGGDEPEAQDWYVLGRLAEHYDAHSAAIAAYRKAKPKRDEDLASSSYQFAMRRLRLLEKVKPQ